jgi:hypothetical protein
MNNSSIDYLEDFDSDTNPDEWQKRRRNSALFYFSKSFNYLIFTFRVFNPVSPITLTI